MPSDSCRLDRVVRSLTCAAIELVATEFAWSRMTWRVMEFRRQKTTAYAPSALSLQALTSGPFEGLTKQAIGFADDT